MVFWTGQEPGGITLPMIEPWNLPMTHLSVPPISIGISNMIKERLYEEAMNEEKGRITNPI